MITNTVANQLRITGFVLKANLEGLTHEESLHRPEPGGNCINWVVGHLVHTQNGAMRVLGRTALWNEHDGACYARGSDGGLDESEAMPLEELLRTYDRAEAEILAGLEAISPERLKEPSPISPTKNSDETVGSLLEKLAFHQAYHLGQVGLLRRLNGHAGAIR
ncbi:MAG: DinB family protein [Candidatus Eisenbacteria bacterium]|uniref:DinB family protein n=1 Tax=Eiseniibacteriota bacterium TaxID=2212470 RepID=A0A956LWP4_UNCEI|nr:DinB family protein [Candidatus Eisenbacteria bacterium]